MDSTEFGWLQFAEVWFLLAVPAVAAVFIGLIFERIRKRDTHR